MAVNGIPIKLKVAAGELATVYFASCRRCPELLGMIKKITDLQEKENSLSRRTAAMQAKVLQGTESEAASFDWTDEDEATATALTHDLNAITIKRLGLVGEFFIKGLTAAGYTEDALDDYLPFFNPDRYDEVVQRALVGCGMVDFFTEGSPQDESLSSSSPKTDS